MNDPDRFDVIVAGVGAMGSAACWHLARRGLRVLGLDRYGIPNTLGSSHGVTRIIRLAYAESSDYVALLRRAYVLWRELETLANERLLVKTGSIDAGPAGNWVVEGSIASCIEHRLQHEVLDAHDLNRRFPALRFPAGSKACLQPDGGFLLAERCVVAHAKAAMSAGAQLRSHEPVLAWQATDDGVVVRTARGTYRAKQLVLAAGAWMGELATPLAGVAVPERQVLGWFQPRTPSSCTPATLPVFNVEFPEGRFYGTPVFGVPGFKLGRYRHREESGRPEDLRALPDATDEALLRVFLDRYMPDAAGPLLNMVSCLFTNTPDGDFVIDRHPDFAQVILASPCSGHGFKFAPVVGEILADLVTDGATRHAIDMFRLDRPALRSAP